MLTRSVSEAAGLLSALTYNPAPLQVVMNNQRKIIWPGGETEKPQGFQMSTRLKVGSFAELLQRDSGVHTGTVWIWADVPPPDSSQGCVRHGGVKPILC